MHFVLFRSRGETVGTVGVLDGRGSVTSLDCSLPELLAREVAEIREAALAPPGARRSLEEVELLPPIDGRMELWAAGVTYQRSRDERMAESTGAAALYDAVYDAPRPELFLKATAWRAVGDGDAIGVRGDSAINVPEPELALLVRGDGAIVGYGVCDDVSSRTIEGENPLYLPQAKIYTASCALGHRVRPAWEIEDPYALTMRIAIERNGVAVYAAEASTGQLKRRFDELVGYLLAELEFPEGAWLSTGTSLVPELPFSLQPGDRVRITIDEVGTLVNEVALASTLRTAPALR